MADGKIRMSVLEGSFAGLQGVGIPLQLPVCIHLQDLGLQLEGAQWTAKQSNTGFSISFFWPVISALKVIKSEMSISLYYTLLTVRQCFDDHEHTCIPLFYLPGKLVSKRNQQLYQQLRSRCCYNLRHQKHCN